MKNLLFLMAFCLPMACSKKFENLNSECLQQKIEQFKTAEHAVSVLTIVSKGERVYKFRTTPGCGDGSIYNENCEVVCPGGKHPIAAEMNCPTADYSEWEVIWEK